MDDLEMLSKNAVSNGQRDLAMFLLRTLRATLLEVMNP
jgi:hypothetical protein